MNKFGRSVLRTLVAGLLVLAPIYLAILLLLKAMAVLAGVAVESAAVGLQRVNTREASRAASLRRYFTRFR